MTFHRAHNYGALLQALALQTFLSEKYNPFFLDYYNKKIYDNYKPFKPLGKNIIKWPIRLLNNIRNFNKRKEKYNTFEKFIDNYLKIKKYEDSTINSCNVLITGSDQVWNPSITGGLLDEFCLKFGGNNIKRISYAASCGSKENIENNSNDFKIKLSDIDNISIREESCKESLKNILDGKNVNIVLDPTMLLSKEEWEKIISKQNINFNGKYIFAYEVAPNEDYVKIVNNLSKKLNLRVLSISGRKIYNNQINIKRTFNPLEFVKLIKEAEYVVTTSFHATVFSVLFNKNFYVVPHEKTGDRVRDLLKKLYLSKRIVEDYNDFINKDIKESIDFKKTNIELANERKKSIDWLQKSID